MSTIGQAAGGIVGGIAGYLIGGPSGAIYGARRSASWPGLLDPPKGPTVSGPRLADLTIQTSTYGASIPRAYGTVPVVGNIFCSKATRLKESVTTKNRRQRWRHQDHDPHLHLFSDLRRWVVPGTDCRRAPHLGRPESGL